MDSQTRELVNFILALCDELPPDNQVRIAVLHSLEVLGLPTTKG